LRFYAAADVWGFTGVNVGLIIKGANTNGNRGAVFTLQATGALRLTWSADGTNTLNATSPVLTAAAGSALWVRVTLDVDNGTGGYDAKFFTSDDGVTWAQFGSTITGGSTTSIFASTFNVNIARFVTSVFGGKVYRAQIWDGIEENSGTKVLDVDCDAITDGSATSFQALTGQTVTINRRNAGRKSVAVPRRNGGGRSLFLLGTDDYFECVHNWQHQLLNFAQGDSLSIVAVVRLWNNVISAGRIIGKYDTAGGAGWAVSSTTTTHGATITAADGVTSQTAATAASTNGAFRVFSGTLDRAAQRITPYLNDAAGTFGTLSNGGLVNVLPLRIGRQSGDSTTYQNLEVTAAAVFRRPLTASEIATITTYYTNRGF
jgi:hypothetical protein